MNDRPTFDVIRETLIEDLDIAPEDIRMESDLESLGIDSLAVIELFFQVEEKLGVTLPNERVPVKTLGDVVVFLDNLRKQARASQPASQSQETESFDRGQESKTHV